MIKLKIRSKVICKFSNYSYTEGEEYTILEEVPTKYLVSSNTKYKYYFDKNSFEKYFITKKELRKLKLNNINDKNFWYITFK